ncbi:MAG TPA: hypothetical protein VF310_02475 [Vicinamibacteria bacterium]
MTGMPRAKSPVPPAAAVSGAPLRAAHLRLGWPLLLVGVLAGTTLEGLLGFKWAPLLEDALRRELLSLAHFHAGLLGLVNLVYAAFADTPALGAPARRLASRALRAGSLCLPLGFLLGGIWHSEGDPGPGILLVPVGAVAIAVALALQARAAWRRE